MTDQEAFVHIKSEEGLSSAEVAHELSLIAGRIMSPQAVDSAKKNARRKREMNSVTPAGVNEHGEELRYAAVCEAQGSEYVTVCRCREHAEDLAVRQYAGLSPSSLGRYRIYVGIVAVKGDGTHYTERDRVMRHVGSVEDLLREQA